MTGDDTNPPPRAKTTTARWLAPAALAVAVIAIVVAVWALVQARSDTSEAGDSAESGEALQPPEAEKRVCDAFALVRQGVQMQTNADLGPDPVAQSAVAANSRLATLGGGEYLLSRLDPATPSDLGDAVRDFAEDLQDIGIKQLAGIPNSDPELSGLLSNATATAQQIADMCA